MPQAFPTIKMFCLLCQKLQPGELGFGVGVS